MNFAPNAPTGQIPVAPASPAAPAGQPVQQPAAPQYQQPLQPGQYMAPPAVAPAAQPAPQYAGQPAPAVPLGGTPTAPAQGLPPSPGTVGGYPPINQPVQQPAQQPAQPIIDQNAFAAVQAQLAQARQQLAQQANYVQLGQQVAAQRLQQPQQQPAAAQQTTSPFGVPQFDLRLKQYLTTDDKGQTVEMPGAPPGTLASYQQYMAAVPEAFHKLVTDPKGTLGPVLLDYIQQEAGKLADDRINRFQSKVRTEQIVQEISPWALARDASGQMVMQISPETGMPEPALSPLGQAYNQACQQLRASGVVDVDNMHKLAMQQVNYIKSTVPQPQPTAQPQQFQQPAYLPQQPVQFSPQQAAPQYGAQPAPQFMQPPTIAQTLQTQTLQQAPSRMYQQGNVVPSNSMIQQSPAAFPSMKAMMRQNAAAMGVTAPVGA